MRHRCHWCAGLRDIRALGSDVPPVSRQLEVAEATATRLAERLLQSPAARSRLAAVMQHAPPPARLLLLLGVLRACERGKTEPGPPCRLPTPCRQMVRSMSL